MLIIHCEMRSDEAIHLPVGEKARKMDCFASARNDGFGGLSARNDGVD
jgi:hypothetical protein